MTSKHYYYDLSYLNSSTTPQQAVLLDNRTTPILNKCSDYHLSVIRFTVPTALIPIFIWEEDPTTPNTANNAYYSITINNTQVFLQYVPQNMPSNPQNPSNLFVYSYQQFIDAINVALKAAFIIVGGAATQPPYMTYDAPTGICSLIGQYAYENVGNYQIYFNQPLFSFFENFEVKRFGYNNVLGKDVQLYIKNNGNNAVVGFPPTYTEGTGNDSYEMKQEYDSLFLFNSARSIVFTTNTVSVFTEALNVNNSLRTTTGSSYQRILTDFQLNIQSGVSNNTVRSYLQYAPTGEYRLLSMSSDSALYTFDVQIFFQTANLKLYPLMIAPGESVSMKIMFRNKLFKSF